MKALEELQSFVLYVATCFAAVACVTAHNELWAVAACLGIVAAALLFAAGMLEYLAQMLHAYENSDEIF